MTEREEMMTLNTTFSWMLAMASVGVNIIELLEGNVDPTDEGCLYTRINTFIQNTLDCLDELINTCEDSINTYILGTELTQD